MRSSSGAAAIVLAIAAGLFVAACSPPPSATPSSGRSSPDCASTAASPQDAQAVTTLRQAIEQGPFYALAARAGVATCRATREDGSTKLEYNFRDGASLHVTRNEATEYTDQELRLASPLGEPPVAVLTRMEHAAFDAKGCGIDWRTVETRKPTDEPDATESVYRGDVCNCQARARSDAAGRVLRLQFRSAC